MNTTIDKIKINRYKCFHNFSIENLKRVNLISGKNNVGKTAFMEACYLVASAGRINNFLFSLTMIEKSRDKLNIFLNDDNNIIDLLQNNRLIDIKSIYNIKYESKEINFKPSVEIYIDGNLTTIDYNNNISFEKLENVLFIDNLGFSNSEFKDVYKAVQFKDKDIQINEFLKSFNFENPKFKIIDNKPYLKTKENGEYTQLSKFGDGIKHYISIACSLYCCENGYLFIDEIENGIHYSLLDNLWEIILKISKEQNIQVFATTHSKECIEAYNRVAKKLGDDEISFINLSTNKKDEIVAITLDSGMFASEMKQNHEVRGW